MNITPTLLTRASGFNFLGFTIKQVWTKYHKILLIRPQKERVKHLLAQVKAILDANKQATVEHVVKQLNLAIRGWAMYYRHCNAKRTFAELDHWVFQKIWRWCVRRHPNKSGRWVKTRYFHAVGGNHWVFSEGACRLVSAEAIHITCHVQVKGYNSPFDPALRNYWAQRAKRGASNRYSSREKKTILAAQDYRCARCGIPFGEEDSIHFHHVIRKKDGGSDRRDNRQAVHQRCHNLLHKRSDYPLPGRLRRRG